MTVERDGERPWGGVIVGGFKRGKRIGKEEMGLEVATWVATLMDGNGGHGVVVVIDWAEE